MSLILLWADYLLFQIILGISYHFGVPTDDFEQVQVGQIDHVYPHTDYLHNHALNQH